MAIHKYTPSDIERFWAKVDTSGGMFACWLWTACTYGSMAYGAFSMHGKNKVAHRISWELAHGDIPDDLMVLHNCPDGDNPRCVNPLHLWLGTHQDNMDDMIQKSRQATSTRQGQYTHPESRSFGESNGRAKLTEEQVREIRRRYSTGTVSQSQLAKEYGMSQTPIARIIQGITWGYIKDKE